MARPLQKPRYDRPYPKQNVRKLQRPKIKAKKTNPFKVFIQLCFIAFFAYFVVPVIYNDYLCPIYINRIQNRFIQSEVTPYSSQVFRTKAIAPIPVSQLYLPKINDNIYNSTLLNQHLLVSQIEKPKMTPLKQGALMLDLTKSLKDLGAKYPQLSPSVFVWDYSDARYVDIDSDKIMPSASIIKIPVLLKLFEEIEQEHFMPKDTMQYDELYRSSGSGAMLARPSDTSYTLDELADLMITVSDNTATNMLMTKSGGMNGVNRAIRNWGLKNTYVSNWLPDLHGTNVTTSHDIATMLYNLDNPKFLNTSAKEYIVDYMSRVKNTTLLKAGLPAEASLIHKTGDIGTMLGDAGVVYTPDGGKYIVVILVKRPFNDYSARDYIVQASSMIYKSFSRSY